MDPKVAMENWLNALLALEKNPSSKKLAREVDDTYGIFHEWLNKGGFLPALDPRWNGFLQRHSKVAPDNGGILGSCRLSLAARYVRVWYPQEMRHLYVIDYNLSCSIPLGRAHVVELTKEQEEKLQQGATLTDLGPLAVLTGLSHLDLWGDKK